MALSVTSRTRALITDFFTRRRAWGLLPASQDDLLTCLDAILQAGEVDAAILLCPGIRDRPTRVRHRTMEVLTALLASASPSRVIGLVTEIARSRTLWSLEQGANPKSITAEEIRLLAADRPACAGILVLLSGHHSGYVREAAVVGLEGLKVAFVVPALRDRLNDWVDPVRRGALRALRGFLSADHAATPGRVAGSLPEPAGPWQG